MGLSPFQPVGTATAMFPHKAPLFMCTFLLPSVISQTFFHTKHGGPGGSFTSFSFGASPAQPQPTSYVPKPQPIIVKQQAYSAPQQTYSQPKTYAAPQQLIPSQTPISSLNQPTSSLNP